MPNNYYFKFSDFDTVKEAESKLIQALNSLNEVFNILKSNRKVEHPEFKPDVWIVCKTGKWSDRKYQLIKKCKVKGKYLYWDCYYDNEISEDRYTRAWELDDIRVADDAEVKDWLVEIAKKIYSVGAKVESVESSNTRVIKDYNLNFHSGRYLQYDGIYIYDAHTDKWSKVIAKPAQKIGSHEVKYEKYYISVGCLRKDIEQWKNLGHVMAEFDLRKIVHADGTSATSGDISKLLKDYDERKDG